MKKIEEAFKNLKIHPFTELQLSDREKFHTGMLKFILDNTTKNLYSEIFRTDFDKQNLSSQLEKNSVDLLITNNNSPYIIVEAKFKTGIHQTKSKGRIISQLQKYAEDNPQVEKGFLISLFKELNEDTLKVENNENIKYFKNITFTGEILDSIKSLDGSEWDDRNHGVLIQLWIDYLKNLKVIVDYVVDSQLNILGVNSDFNVFKKYSDELKLSGLFERYRLCLILDKISFFLTDNNYKKSIEDFGKIDNTHGNALLEFPMDFKNPSNNLFKSYGIQWQTDKLKFFVVMDNHRLDDEIEKTREDYLLRIGKELQLLIKKDKSKINGKINRKGKFRSINIYERSMFDEVNDMPKMILKILNKIEDI